MSEHLLSEFVEAKLAVAFAEIDRRLFDVELPQATAEMSARGILWSSMAIERALSIGEAALIQKIEARANAESEAHRRAEADLSADRVEKIRSDLRGVVDTDLTRIFRTSALRSLPGRMPVDFAARTDPVERRLLELVEQSVDLLRAELAMPPEPKGGDVYIQNINAPNFGQIASRIDSLRLGDTESPLLDLLHAVKGLPDEQRDQALELVEGLVIEVERPQPQRNRIGVGAILDRIREFAPLISAADTVARWFESFG